MNRGRLRKIALGVLAAASLGVTLFFTAGGIAHADTTASDTSTTTTVVKTITDTAAAPESTLAESGWS
jgi:hypothetical protein